MTFQLTRRALLQGAGITLAGSVCPLTAVASGVKKAIDAMPDMYWGACVVNCGNRCALRVFTKNGQVIRIETDNTSNPCCPQPYQLRACLRGRSMRQRLYNPDRLKFPMKRVGERGEAKFERISWDEAYQLIADNWQRILKNYGPDSVYINYATAQQTSVSGSNCWKRLANLTGGYLNWKGSYSSAQITAAFPMTYGRKVASSPTEIAHAKLYVSFGDNLSVTRISGGSMSWQFLQAIEKNHVKTIVIDPICTDTVAGKVNQWIPILPGTDAALCEALAYEFITHNWVDQEFLDKYCVGYDEKTLPKSAPKNGDYKSYILGKADGVAKTPAYASAITGIPEETIIALAREMGTTKPVFVAQGLGPQRLANGEETARAIAMLPILLGQVGLPGTSSGMEECGTDWWPIGIPRGNNPVKASIPSFMWTEAILRGHEMTATHDGVKGVDRLKNDIKMVINSGGNILINQHSDCGRTDKILRDTSKCEFIVVCDNMMTASCRYADVLLPDTLGNETEDLVGNGDSMGETAFITPIHKAVNPQWEQRSTWEICRGITEKMGLEAAYTEGRTQRGWIEWAYEQNRKQNPELPDFKTFWATGPHQLLHLKWDRIAFSDFRADPAMHPLKTPSGKIEIYSEQLAKIAETWTLPKGDVITALPKFVRTWEMAGDPKAKTYPLQCYGYHGHGRVHSSFHNLPWVREAHPDRVLVNPVNAEERGLFEGQKVRVFNDRGAIEIAVHITPRIIPGVCALPQGAWYRPVKKNGKTVDIGGCINTLTSPRPSPLAKGNPSHTNLVQIEPISA